MQRIGAVWSSSPRLGQEHKDKMTDAIIGTVVCLQPEEMEK